MFRLFITHWTKNWVTPWPSPWNERWIGTGKSWKKRQDLSVFQIQDLRHRRDMMDADAVKIMNVLGQYEKTISELIAGLVTNPMVFCWLFVIKDWCVKKCVFNKRKIKVCASCCWRCPGTSTPSAPPLRVSFYLCSSGSVEGLIRAPCQLKNPFEGPRRWRGSCWEERKRIVFPE